MNGNSNEDIINREREFHNARFSEENRQKQQKYHTALKSCNQQYYSLIKKYVQDSDVLEYGCATGGESIKIAPSARSVVGIDISDVAIQTAKDSSLNASIDNAEFYVMDAQNMTFEDDSFDFVFGSGIIHHLDVTQSLKDIHRVLKVGGVAVFKEPLGENVIMNLYRNLTPKARTVDEHPLMKTDFDIIHNIFESTEVKFYGLFTLFSVPLYKFKIQGPVYSMFRSIDKLLAKSKWFRWQFWAVVIEMRK